MLNTFLHTRLTFIMFVLFLLCAGGMVFISDVFAGGDFSDRYHAYQNDVSAGKTALDKKDYESAIKYFTNAISVSPFEASSYYQRGVALYKIGEEKDAVEDFNRALIIDPRMISAYVYRGLCREKTGQYADALKDYTTALSMNPKDANIHNNLAWLYATVKDEKVKDNIKALEHAVKAAEISNEGNAEILDTLAMVYFVNRKIKEAVETEQKALKLSPDNERFKGNLKRYEEVKGE